MKMLGGCFVFEKTRIDGNKITDKIWRCGKYCVTLQTEHDK